MKKRLARSRPKHGEIQKLLNNRWLSGGGLLYFTAANAGRADTDTLTRSSYQSMDILQIDVPAAIRNVMGVADAVPKLGTFATYFTDFCHRTHLA